MVVFFFLFLNPTAMSVFSFSQSSWTEFLKNLSIQCFYYSPTLHSWAPSWTTMITVVLVVTMVIVTTHAVLSLGWADFRGRWFSQISSNTVITTLILHREVKVSQPLCGRISTSDILDLYSALLTTTLQTLKLCVFFWVSNSLLLFILKIYLPLISFKFYSICEELLLMCSNTSALKMRPVLWSLLGWLFCRRASSWHPAISLCTILGFSSPLSYLEPTISRMLDHILSCFISSFWPSKHPLRTSSQLPETREWEVKFLSPLHLNMSLSISIFYTSAGYKRIRWQSEYWRHSSIVF